MTFGEDEEEDEGIGFIRSVKEKVRVETELQHLQTLIQDMQKVSQCRKHFDSFKWFCPKAFSKLLH